MEKQKEILRYWNEKKIVVHSKITSDIKKSMVKVLRDYEVDEIKQCIDLYNTILKGEQYFWEYKWNLWEFLNRGVKQFFGKEPKNYLRQQMINSPVALILKR